MTKEKTEKLDGIITKVESNGYWVDLDVGFTIFARISGNIRRFKISLIKGDKVECDISPYDLTKGRIIKRY